MLVTGRPVSQRDWSGIPARGVRSETLQPTRLRVWMERPFRGERSSTFVAFRYNSVCSQSKRRNYVRAKESLLNHGRYMFLHVRL